MTARRSLFPGGVCKIKCKADIAGGVWATSQSQVYRVTWQVSKVYNGMCQKVYSVTYHKNILFV